MKPAEKKLRRKTPPTNVVIPAELKRLAAAHAKGTPYKTLSGLVVALLEKEINRGPNLSSGEIQDKLISVEETLRLLKKQQIASMQG